MKVMSPVPLTAELLICTRVSGHGCWARNGHTSRAGHHSQPKCAVMPQRSLRKATVTNQWNSAAWQRSHHQHKNMDLLLTVAYWTPLPTQSF